MARSISTSLLPGLVPASFDPNQTCAIVIDVLRATTVMATAGNAGVTRIQTCGEIEQAFEIAAGKETRPLLCGERECKPIPGFDLGNSPAEYTPGVVADREMLLTTTNGTRAIESVIDTKRLLVSSFRNLDATVMAVSEEQHVHLVCAGTCGEISYEDVLLAGAMIARLDSIRPGAELNDPSRIALSAWNQSGASDAEDSSIRLRDALRQSLGGRNLIRVGYEQDIDRCAEIGTIDGFVERVRRGQAEFEFRR